MPERTSLHSFNLLWLMWAVCGGVFITNFILSNWLAILIKPVFEEPVDTVQVRLGSELMVRMSCPLTYNTQDVHERGLTVYMRPGYAVWRQVLTQLPPPFPDLGQGMTIASSWTEFRNISKHQAIGQGGVDSWRQYVDILLREATSS